MNNDAMKELSIMLAEIKAIEIEVEGMKVANYVRTRHGLNTKYHESEFVYQAKKIRAIIDKMRRIDTRPGVS